MTVTTLPPAVFSWPPSAITFAVAFAALSAGHWLADYWIQTHSQATRKALPGWPGRRACLGHVLTYTATLAVFLLFAADVLAVPLSLPRVALALAANGVLHFVADRRVHLRRLAIWLSKGEYWDVGGSAPLDQSFHWFCLFLIALVIAI